MADEEEMARLASEIQLQQSRGDAIRQQMQQLQNTAVDLGGAMDAVANIKKAKGDTLVPVGAGVYISCPKPDTTRVVFSVGANIMVEKKPEEAIKMLQERQKKITEAMNSAQQDLQAILRSIEDLTVRANSLAVAEERNVRPSKE